MALTQLLLDQCRNFGYMFYIAPMDEWFPEKLRPDKHLPVETIPTFTVLILLEQLVHWLDGKGHRFSLNDGLTSVIQGMLMQMAVLLNGGISILVYIWVHENYRLMELPWNSWTTWCIVFLLVDFGYYWLHRLSHEVNILWAGHQVHHSSEFYNLTTALRQSILQEQFFLFYYVPLALCVPPQVFLIHKELNLVYQFWIHSQLVKNVGPLEYILNTPSHHRVHHGINRYCIDKNYAGVLIIWDRMFGTFCSEGEEVVYGLTHQIQTFDPYTIQFGHLRYIIQQFKEQKNWGDKLSVLFKGPGWTPGQPRLGNPEDIPDVHAPVTVWNPSIKLWLTVYSTVQFFVLGMDYAFLVHQKNVFNNYLPILGQCCYIFLGLIILGAFLEGDRKAIKYEIVRLLAYPIVSTCVPMLSFKTRFGPYFGPLFGAGFPVLCAVSCCFMLYQLINGESFMAEQATTKVVQASDKSD